MYTYHTFIIYCVYFQYNVYFNILTSLLNDNYDNYVFEHLNWQAVGFMYMAGGHHGRCL